MAHVQLHEFDPELVAENVQDAIRDMERMQTALRRSASPAYSLFRHARLAAHMGWGLSKDPVALADRLRVMARAGLLVFEGALNPQGSVRHDLSDGEIDVPSEVDPDLAETELWIDCAHAGFLLRDRTLLERLAAASDPSGAPSAPRYQSSYAKALRHLIIEDVIEGAFLIEAMRATEPEALPPAHQELALTIFAPNIMLTHLIGLRDTDRTQALVEEWAGRRQTHFDTLDRCMDPRGFLALGQAALCAIARDRGMRISVESDDLPETLIAAPA